MIALIPSDADLGRLALDGGESVDQLHLTLYYLGEDTDIDESTRQHLVSYMEGEAAGSIEAEAFGAAVWNPNGEDPCTVLNVNGDGLVTMHGLAQLAVETSGMTVPDQYTPWNPHICLAYDPTRVTDAVSRTGPVIFDKVRLAFGGEVTDISLESSDRMLVQEASTVPWHTVNGHASCPASRPWAVVKDADGEVEGCHASEQEANDQMAALYASESDNTVAGTKRDKKVYKPPRIKSSVSASDIVVTPITVVEAPPTTTNTTSSNGSINVTFESVLEAPAADDVMGVEGDDSRWHGVLAVEGVETGDGRIFAENALVWRDLPLSLYWQRKTADGHDASVIVGNITNIWRDGNLIRGEGFFNLNAPEGGDSWRDAHDAFQLVKDGFMRGVSVTLDDIKDHDVEMVWPENAESAGDGLDALFMQPENTIFHHGRILDGTLTGQPALQEAFISIGATPANLVPAPTAVVAAHQTTTSDEPWDTDKSLAALPPVLEAHVARAAFAYVGLGDQVNKIDCRFLHHNISANGLPAAANLTACAAGIGALNGARGGTNLGPFERQVIYEHLAAHLRDADREPTPLVSIEEAEAVAVLTAALNVPVAPPAEWFENPQFTEITPLQVGDDGFIRGHLARWGVCHTSFSSTCVTPPFEEEFSFFTTGEIQTREGTRFPVGQLTLGTGHAPTNLGARPAAAHYDHTGFAVADVACGADDHGIWVAGALCPDIDEVTVRRLRASALSGDWRRIGGQLRLVAALVVNVPGFPIPRTRTHTHDGAQATLVASGVIPNTEMIVPKDSYRLPKGLKERLAASIGRDPGTRRRELLDRVHGAKVG